MAGAALLVGAVAIVASPGLVEWVSGACPMHRLSVAALAAPEGAAAPGDAARFFNARDRLTVGVARPMRVSEFRELYHIGARARLAAAEDPDHALADTDRLLPGGHYQVELTPKAEEK